MAKTSIRLVDEFLNVHLSGEKLGQGGQGVVYRTSDPDIAVKLLTNNDGTVVTDENVIRRYNEQLRHMQLLPIPDNVPLAKPVAQLKGLAGYVMPLLNEMMPFSHFWPDDKNTESVSTGNVPEWLEKVPFEFAKVLIHYRNTGGLRRRLLALYKCAATLAQLHGQGLVYGDVSPQNVFISSSLDLTAVWLIDADNMRFETTSGRGGVYTPKYGAPELVQGLDGARPSSDCYAFAVMAFYLLSTIHPFIGNLVQGDDSDWADESQSAGNMGSMDEQAYAGHLPWVDDPEDDSNAATGGLPRSLLLNPQLQHLFEQTFGQGRIKRSCRPTIFHWPQALAGAADKTVQCPGCGMSYFYDIDRDTCPYCQSSKPPMWLFKASNWPADATDEHCWVYAKEQQNTSAKVYLPKRLLAPFSLTDGDTPMVEITQTERSIQLHKMDDCSLGLSLAFDEQAGRQFSPFHAHVELPLSTLTKGFWLYVASAQPRVIHCVVSGSQSWS
jgi:hypothetical protein